MDEKQINELLECPVCLERLDQTCKVLPCQHTFCRRCLGEILDTNRELCCPECRAVVTVRIADLPTNILVVRILEGLKTKNQRAAAIIGGGMKTQGPGSLSSSPSRVGHSSPSHSSAHLSRQNSQPCAKALYNYESAEKDDLMFKRGDVIQLRRQVDENWYHGELSGKLGFFPANFVQVLVPLPQVPQCRALYDFDLKDENEKDCLSFKKDEVLTVIRRIDENWLEGRKGDKIGIFPISFVEPNDSARTLINSNILTSSSWSSSSRPTPSINSSSTSSPSSSTVAAIETAVSSMTISSSLATSLSESTVSTSPTSISQAPPALMVSTTASPPLAPSTSSPTSSQSTSPQPVAQTTCLSTSPSETSDPSQNKRHSFTSSSTTPAAEQGSQGHRHSLEVTCESACQLSASSSPPSSISPTTDMDSIPPGQAVESSDVITTTTASTSSCASNSQSGSLTTPVYTALYNYKPQKDDELDLHKGEHYTVVEKCQDGWFKGACLRTGKAGVFPGNYVNMIRHSSAFKPVNPNVLNIRAKGPAQAHTHNTGADQKSASTGSSEVTRSSEVTNGHHMAPPLMPRVARLNSASHKSRPGICSSSGSPALCTSQGHSPSHRHHTSSQCPTTPSHLPGHHPSSSRPLQTTVVPAPPPSTRGASPHRTAWVSPAHMSASAIITPPNVALTHSADTATATHAKKEKKEKVVKGLGKLLGGKIKKNKSSTSEPEVPAAPSALCFDNIAIAHVRSGSYPLDSSPQAAGDVPARDHRKAASLDETPTPPIPAKPRPKPPIRHRYWCIVPYPPQTDRELSLELGDIIHVHRKGEDGWYKGTQERTGRTGMFPASFVEKCD